MKRWWLLIIVAVVLAAIIFTLAYSSNTGTLVLQITDAPPGVEITSVVVQLSSVEIHKSPGSITVTNDTNAAENLNWIRIIGGPVTYDLIQIKDAIELLGTAELEPGKYTQIRLNVDSATATIDGVEQTLSIPSETVRIARNFDIVKGETTTLILDFDAEDSINQQGNNQYRMDPVVRIISVES